MTITASYETLLDVAKMVVEYAADHPEAQYHRRRLNEIAAELDSMRGAVLTNKGLAD